MGEEQIESSQTQLHQLRRLFLPSTPELLSYLAISVVFLLVGVFSSIKSYIIVARSPSELASVIPNNMQEVIQRIQSGSLLPSVATALFWAAVAGILYILFWVVANVVIATRNDIVVVENYIKPAHYKETTKAWYETAESFFLRLAAVVALSGLTFASTSILIPVYLSEFNLAVANWSSPGRLLGGALGVVGLIALLHFYVVFLRLLLLRTRIIS